MISAARLVTHIASLLRTDVTEVETAIAALRTVAQQLRDGEARLGAAGRPFAMRKVQSVRQRVYNATVGPTQPSSTTAFRSYDVVDRDPSSSPT